jgi:hypothetical protein
MCNTTRKETEIRASVMWKKFKFFAENNDLIGTDFAIVVTNLLKLADSVVFCIDVLWRNRGNIFPRQPQHTDKKDKQESRPQYHPRQDAQQTNRTKPGSNLALAVHDEIG